MTEHPITPPPELVAQWVEYAGLVGINEHQLVHLATQAARWGGDQELEACLAEVSFFSSRALAGKIRDIRHPKPLSLKEQALQILDVTQKGWGLAEVDLDTIRQALEALPND